jgi:hypothetical protein
MEEKSQPETPAQSESSADPTADIVGQTINLLEARANMIDAEQVTMSESMANEIAATQLEMAQSLAVRIHSDRVEMNNSGVGLLQANSVQATNAQALLAQINELKVENGSFGVVSAGTAEIINGRTALLMSREVHGEAIRSGVLLAGKIEGSVETLIDTPRAMLAGLTAGVAIGLVLLLGNLLLRRK